MSLQNSTIAAEKIDIIRALNNVPSKKREKLVYYYPLNPARFRVLHNDIREIELNMAAKQAIELLKQNEILKKKVEDKPVNVTRPWINLGTKDVIVGGIILLAVGFGGGIYIGKTY